MTRRDARLFFLLFAAAAALLLGPLLLGGTHYMGDVLRSFQPWLSFAAQELQAGRLPLWNPYAACGEPFLANPQAMIFFPPAQLFWFLPFTVGWRLFLLLGQFCLMGALYSLYRSRGRAGAAVGALAVAWSGFALIHWEFPGALAALAFAVVFLLFAARGAWAGAPAATALLFLAGYTQFAYYAVIAGGFLLLARAAKERRAVPVAGFAAAAGVGLLLAAPQILASWEVTRQSIRAVLDDGAARAHLLSPLFLIKSWIPAFHGKTVSPYVPMPFGPEFWPVRWNWLTTFYVGVAAPALAAAGAWGTRRTFHGRAWILLGAAALALAMGLEPFFTGLRHLVPGMRYMTHFANASVIALIAVGALAAASFSQKNQTPLLLVLSAAAALCASQLWWPEARQWATRGMLGVEALTPEQHQWIIGASRAPLLLCLAALGLSCLKRGRAAALIVFTLFDLFFFGRDLQPTAGGDFYMTPVPLARALQGQDARFSIDPLDIRNDARPLDGATPEAGYQSLRQTLPPNVQVPFRIHQTWGHEVFPLQTFAEFRRTIPLEKPLVPALDFVGARYLLTTRALPPPAVYRAERPNAFLYENPGALPRVTRVDRARVLTEKAARLKFLASGWNPREEVVLEEEAAAVAQGGGEWSWDDARPGRLSAWGEGGGGWLVWSQVFYPGWEAYVNGERAPLRRANHAFQTVALPAGPWRVEILYRPGTMWMGLAAAMLAMMGLMLWGVRRLEILPRELQKGRTA